ncbi:long-tail fiber proximal subunit [Aeromonas phage avDM14-QBC]|nr:long-tail fiber proximal subunit [Aeromonas phage avDM14-QBC]UYD58651.1 long-tail fiber proximal subunit [Aeromonas phage avDM10-HWA]UYD59046.1 long-tail fiber proximal subunit [Aeromonas phage avDM7-IJDJ]
MFDQPFRATSGLDAAGEKVINVAIADKATLSDGVNVEFFHKYNTIYQYDPSRGYDARHAVIYERRIYFAKADIASPAGTFDPLKWTGLRVDPTWQYVNSVAGAMQLVSGQYITADNRFNNLIFNLPAAPIDGDTIVIKDVGGQPGVNDLVFSTIGAAIIEFNGKTYGNTFRGTVPFCEYVFVYKVAGNRWQLDTCASTEQSYFVAPSSQGFQLQSGMTTWRQTAQGQIRMILPKFANHGDVIRTHDIDGLNAINHSTLEVYPDSGHSINEAGVSKVESRTSGYGSFVFDEPSKTWEIWDGDQRTRIRVTKADTSVMPFEHILVTGDGTSASRTVTLTLPEKVAIGDRVQVTMDYMRRAQTCTIRVKPNSGEVIVGSKAQMQFQRRSEYPAINGWELVSSVSINADTDYVPYVELMYAELDPALVGVTGSKFGWMFGQVQPKVERVDATQRDRLGVAALAAQSEVDKNHEQNPNDETIVTPLTLSRKTATETRRGIARIATTGEVSQISTATYLDDVIVTPKKLNARTATETRRGLAEIATQGEANGSTDDTTIVTPKKLHNRVASETLTGILAIVKKSGTPGTARNLAGVGVYNRADHLRAVTPATLDEFVATETAKGVGYIATQLEVDGGSTDSNGPLLVTAERLAARRASESNHGLIEIATQAETNAGVDDTRAITPKKLNDRTAQEARTGIAAIATHAEVNIGTEGYKIVSPLKLKTRFDNMSRVEVDGAAGLTRSGTIWDKVSIGIVPATESQRGTLRVATQVEANGSTSDDTMITPKKLDGRKATRSLDGIIRIGTTTEVRAGTLSSVAVCPADLIYMIQTEPTWSGNESRRGSVKTATMESTFVGNNTAGSTQAYTSYANDGLAVSPRGLNYALQNFLPKMATAQNSLSLGGVVANDWIRRTVAQTVTGAMTFTAAMTTQAVTGTTSTFNLSFIESNRSDALTIGSANNIGVTGITFIAGNKGSNKWKLYAGNDSAVDGVGVGGIGFAPGVDGPVLHVTVAGDSWTKRNIVSRNGHLVLEDATSRITMGNLHFASVNTGIVDIGSSSRSMKLISANDNVKINNFDIIHAGNQAQKLDPIYLRRDGGNTQTGKVLAAMNGDVKYNTYRNDNRYISSRGNDFVFGNTDTTNGRVCLDSNKNPIVKIGNFEYEIYHKGNKPTAQDVGAVDITGSAANNLTIRDWIKIGNVKIVANNLLKTVEFIWEE